MDTTTKRCSKCGEIKPLSEFNRRNDRKSGFTSACKDCNRKMCHQYGLRNSDHLRVKKHAKYWENPQLARNRKNSWYAAHKKKIGEQSRIRYWSHPDKFRDKARRWARNHSEKHNKNARNWRRAHPIHVRTYAARRRAMTRQADGSHTPAEITEQYKRQRGKCYYCQCKLGDKYHVDHVVPLSRGGSNSIDNLVLACPECNLRKQDKLPHEWDEGGRLL